MRHRIDDDSNSTSNMKISKNCFSTVVEKTEVEHPLLRDLFCRKIVFIDRTSQPVCVGGQGVGGGEGSVCHHIACYLYR